MSNRIPGFCKCDRCQKLYTSGSGDVVFVPNGEERWWRVDGRERSFPYHRQATHSRVGWEDEHQRRVGCPDGERLCYRCRGVERPAPQPTIGRRAASAWEEAIKENPALRRFAPKHLR